MNFDVWGNVTQHIDICQYRRMSKSVLELTPVQAVAGDPGLDRVHGVDVLDLDAEVVERAALAGVLDEHELQRRLGHREVRVPGADLGGLGAEEPAVEVDRGLEVVHVDGELEAGHGVAPSHR